MSFSISGLPIEQFQPLFAMDDDALAARGVRRVVADAKPGYPCRISLNDAEPGQTVLLMNHEHHAVDSPYRAAFAIYVSQAADRTWTSRDETPHALRGRPISLRAFNADGMLVGAEVAPGDSIEAAIERRFEDPRAAYLHAHNAAHGCFVARVDRA